MKFIELFKLTGRRISLLILGTAAALTIGYITPRQWSRVSGESCSITIYVSGSNLHTNLIVPVKTNEVDWKSHLNLAEIEPQGRNDYNFLSFGWGERDFYLTTPTLQDLRLSTTLRALLLPTESVLYVRGHHTLPKSSSQYQVKPVKVSRQAYWQLTEFLLSSFARDWQGEPIRIRESNRYNGSFYIAKGYYSVLRTCNDWTATGLRVAKVNTPVWSGLAPAVFKHLRAGCT